MLFRVTRQIYKKPKFNKVKFHFTQMSVVRVNRTLGSFYTAQFCTIMRNFGQFCTISSWILLNFVLSPDGSKQLWSVKKILKNYAFIFFYIKQAKQGRSKKELYSKVSFFKASPIGTEVEVGAEQLPSVYAQSIAHTTV